MDNSNFKSLRLYLHAGYNAIFYPIVRAVFFRDVFQVISYHACIHTDVFHTMTPCSQRFVYQPRAICETDLDIGVRIDRPLKSIFDDKTNNALTYARTHTHACKCGCCSHSTFSSSRR